MKNKNAYIQMSFAWVFALIVGAIILFLAIYAVTKLMGAGQYTIDTETAKKIEVLLNPLETSFESEISTSMNLPVETKIYLSCDKSGNFGYQEIELSQKTFEKWPEPGAKISFANKYIFSESIIEGKKFYLFSRPFKFPFKVADIIILIPADKQYCFLDAPEQVERDILDLQSNGQDNIKVKDCSSSDIRVCFESMNIDGCDIKVNYELGYVEKNNKMYFPKADLDPVSEKEDISLMYGAIFSDSEMYECQVKRMMKRMIQLISLYTEKSALVSEKGCMSNLDVDLTILSNSAQGFKDSRDFVLVESLVERIEEQNNIGCNLW